jgi:hypothetical protein
MEEYNPQALRIQRSGAFRGSRAYILLYVREESIREGVEEDCEGQVVISWSLARRVAVAFAARTERDIPAKRGAFDYPAAVEAAFGPLAEFTGISLPRSERPVRVADRAEWIDFNIESFQALLEPVLQRASAGASDITWAFGKATLTAQIGLLLGFLSARVLGQYDTGPLVAGRKPRKRPGEPGEIFFLDGNIASAAGRIGGAACRSTALHRAARDYPRVTV